MIIFLTLIGKITNFLGRFVFIIVVRPDCLLLFLFVGDFVLEENAFGGGKFLFLYFSAMKAINVFGSWGNSFPRTYSNQKS